MTEKNRDDVLTGNALKKTQSRVYLLAAEETGFVKSMFIRKGRQKQKVWYKTES